MNCKHCNNPIPDGAKFCVKCGQKTDTEVKSVGEQKTEKKSPVGAVISIIVFILAFVGVRYLTQETISPSTNSNYSKSELITETVREVKASMTLPAQIDEATTLVDVTAQPNAIRYHYTLSGVDTSSLSNSYLKSYLGPDLCKNQDTRNLLDQDIGMEYSYIVENSTQTYFVSFTKADCL